MLTQAEEEIQAAADRQEVTTTRVTAKKRNKKNRFLILDTREKWDVSAKVEECKRMCNGL